MTDPNHVIPAETGWWVRPTQVGINTSDTFHWQVTVAGVGDFGGALSGNYGWVGLAAGVNPHVEFVEANHSATTTVTIPTHAVGEIIVIFAYHNNASTIPNKPSASGTVPAWVDIDTNGGVDNNASRTAYFVASATNHTSGTWTGAGGMIAVVLRGQGGTPIGGHAESGGNDVNNSIAPAVTLADSAGDSVLLHFFGARQTGSVIWSAAPAGYVKRADGTSTCLITKGTTTTDGAVTQPHGTNTLAGYRGATVEIRR